MRQRSSCLFKLVGQEQMLRHTILEMNQITDASEEFSEARLLIGRILHAVDNRNRTWLGEEVTERGWFTIGEYGQEADFAAFLIVQHADIDLAFQRSMLELLSEHLSVWQTDGRNYAYLLDRIAVNSGEVQLYGTQGWCTGMGEWEPRELAGTIEDVEERRQEIGLWTPLETYIERNAQNCAFDQRY